MVLVYSPAPKEIGCSQSFKHHLSRQTQRRAAFCSSWTWSAHMSNGCFCPRSELNVQGEALQTVHRVRANICSTKTCSKGPIPIRSRSVYRTPSWKWKDGKGVVAHLPGSSVNMGEVGSQSPIGGEREEQAAQLWASHRPSSCMVRLLLGEPLLCTSWKY